MLSLSKHVFFRKFTVIITRSLFWALAEGTSSGWHYVITSDLEKVSKNFRFSLTLINSRIYGSFIKPNGVIDGSREFISSLIKRISTIDCHKRIRLWLMKLLYILINFHNLFLVPYMRFNMPPAFLHLPQTVVSWIMIRY